MKETIEQAWLRIYGSRFDHKRSECIYFAVGFNAGVGRA